MRVAINLAVLSCDSVPSLPEYAEACQCRNIVVDVDAERGSVKHLDNSKLYVKINNFSNFLNLSSD